MLFIFLFFFFFFNDTATTEIYTLSLQDALPIFGGIPAHERIDEQHVGRENVGGCGHDAARSTEVLAREEEYATRRRHESQHEDDLHGVNDVQNWYERDRANGIISERRVVVEDRVSVAVVEVGRPTR